MLNSTVSFFSIGSKGDIFIYTSFDSGRNTVKTKYQVNQYNGFAYYLTLKQAQEAPLGSFWHVKPSKSISFTEELQMKLIDEAIRLTVELANRSIVAIF